MARHGVQDQPDTDTSTDHGSTVSLGRSFPDETSATRAGGYSDKATGNGLGVDTRSLADMADVGPDLGMTTVLEESRNGGGFTKNNTPVGAKVAPAKINPGLRGKADD